MKYIIIIRALFFNELTQLNRIDQDLAGFQISEFRKKKRKKLHFLQPLPVPSGFVKEKRKEN
jgi:hypothetical protein